jgi:purine nucleosidase
MPHQPRQQHHPLRKTCIDTDTGVDDAVALVLAANSPELAVVGLTTVAGNADVDQCTRNVLLLAEWLWKSDGPRVAEGASAPLAADLLTAPEVHGDDGLGGAFGTLPAPTERPVNAPARAVIENLAASDVTLAATGPLTNLALALRSDRDSLARFKRIVIMGGALDAPGNTGPFAEFNFFVDPHAADALLRSGLDVTVVPLDVTTKVALTRGRLEELPGWGESLDLAHRSLVDAIESGRGTAAVLARALDHYIHYQYEESGLDAGYMHDPVAVASAFAPGIIGTRELPLAVTLEGPERGRSITASDGRPPVKVALTVDLPAVLDLLDERVLKPLFG